MISANHMPSASGEGRGRERKNQPLEARCLSGADKPETKVTEMLEVKEKNSSVYTYWKSTKFFFFAFQYHNDAATSLDHLLTLKTH